MDILFLLALILLNGLFAMSEIALVTSRKARLQKLAEEGDVSAATALRLSEDPTRFLSTVQIGITTLGILSGIVGESALAEPMAELLRQLGVPEASSKPFAFIAVVVCITFTSIVLGELVPKRIGQNHPESVARFVARPLNWISIATKPFGFLLSASTHALMKLLGLKAPTDSGLTEEEIHAVLAEGRSAGVIESTEHAMVRNVFRLDDRQIVSLMVPRGEVDLIDLNQPAGTNIARIEESDHAYFPVVRGGLWDIVGVLNARKMLLRLAREGNPDFESDLAEPLYVPESVTGMELLESFRSTQVRMAFVIDEYGEVLGVVTLRDLIEAITGEFRPRDETRAWAVQREDGSWLLDGHIPIPELKDTLELKAVPEEHFGRYHTLSGMLMLLTGRVPREADYVEWENWRFEIVDMDGNSIDKILASQRLSAEPVNAPAGPTDD